MLFADRHLGAHIFDPGGRRLADPVAAPVLVLRPPGGVHRSRCRTSASSPRSSRCSRGARCSATPASSSPRSPSPRLSVGVWAHHMFTTGAVQLALLRRALDADRGADRGEVLQLDRHDVGRPHRRSATPMLFAVGVPRSRSSSAASPASSLAAAADRLPGARTRTSSSPTCTTCCSAARCSRSSRRSTTGSRSSPAASSTSGSGKVHLLLMFVGFHLTFLVQSSLGLRGHAAPGRELPADRRLHDAQPDLVDRRVPARRVDAAVPLERVALAAPQGERAGDDPWERARRSSGPPPRRRRPTTSTVRCRRSARTARCGTCHHPAATKLDDQLREQPMTGRTGRRRRRT